MSLLEINRALVGLTVEELRKLNHSVCLQLKAKRALADLTTITAIVPGQTYKVKGLRRMVDEEVKVIETRRSRVLIEDSLGKKWTIPASCIVLA